MLNGINNQLNKLPGAISRIPVSSKAKKAFLATSKEGPVAVLPLELSVIVGRTVAAIRRSGFLEMQERLLEEIAVAIVWLFGVKYMGGIYDKLLAKHRPQWSHLPTDTAWKPLGKKLSVELTGAERQALSSAERKLLNKIKFGRLGFSTGLATLTAALVIPWLNKKKTDWIMKRYYPQEAAHTPQSTASQSSIQSSGQQFSVPQASVPQRPQYVRRGQAPQTAFSTPQVLPQQLMPQAPYNSPFYTSQPSQPSPFTPSFVNQPVPPANGPWVLFEGSQAQAANKIAEPKFGLAAGGLISALGHAVEQTPYGALLTVDAGLSGGRGYVYGKRSPFEGAEVVARDLMSIYFYMFATPHMMKLGAKLVDPLLKTSLRLEPTVAEMLEKEFLSQLIASQPTLQSTLQQLGAANPAIQKALITGNFEALLSEAAINAELKNALSSIKISPEQIRALVEESHTGAYSVLRDTMASRIRQADTSALMNLMQKEIAVSGLSDEAAQLVKSYIQNQLGSPAHLSADELQRMLEAIQQAKGGFEKLLPAHREDLIVAVKQSFRHTVGEVIAKDNMLKNLGVELPTSLTAEMEKRLSVAGHQHGIDKANSMLRRVINVARPNLAQADNQPLFKQLETMAAWIERANARQISLEQLLLEEKASISEAIEGLAKSGRLNLKGASFENVLSQAMEGHSGSLKQLSEAISAMKVGRFERLKNWITGHSNPATRIEELYSLLHPEAVLKQTGETKAALVAERLLSLRAGATQLSESAMTNQLLGNMDALMQVLKETLAANTDDASKKALSIFEEYVPQITKLLSGQEGRLFSLYLSNAHEAIQEQMAHAFQGGMAHDPALLSKALNTLNELPAFSRMFNKSKGSAELKEHMHSWLMKLMSFEGTAAEKQAAGKLANWMHGAEPLSLFSVMEKTNLFRRLSQNSHYIFRVVAMAGSILGLGVLVPKLQYAFTKKLTGKNEHPGLGHGKKPKSAYDPKLFNGVPIDRNRFQWIPQA